MLLFKSNIYYKKGFTLVEMMVAIAVFSIVMVTAMSALLNVIDANNKAKAIKTAINNISFALEGISKDMRVGTEYGCIDADNNDTACERTGNVGIKYRSIRASEETVGIPPVTRYKYVYYKFVGKQIWSCLELDPDTCNSNSDFTPITSEEVTLTKVLFYVLNTDTNTKQPRMIMTVTGKAGVKTKIETMFDLQTSISQMTRN